MSNYSTVIHGSSKNRFVVTDGMLFLFGLVSFASTYLFSEGFLGDQVPDYIYAARLFSFYPMLLNEISRQFRYYTADYAALVLVAIAAVSAFVCGRTNLLLVSLIIFFGRNVDFRLIAKAMVGTIGFWLILIIALSQLSVIDENYVLVGDRLRSALGFSWPSRPQNYYLTFCMLFVYLKKADIKWIHIFVLVLFALLMFSKTDSRSPFLLTLILFGLVSLHKLDVLHLLSKGLKSLLVPIFIFSMLLTFVSALLYSPGSPMATVLNAIFSNRLAYSHNAFMLYPITLFGSPVFGAQNDGWFGSYIDSAYMNLLFTYGFIILVFWIYGLTKVVCWAFDNKDEYLLVCLMVTALHGIPEAQLIMIQYTPFLILLPSAMAWSYAKNIKKRGSAFTTYCSTKVIKDSIMFEGKRD